QIVTAGTCRARSRASRGLANFLITRSGGNAVGASVGASNGGTRAFLGFHFKVTPSAAGVTDVESARRSRARCCTVVAAVAIRRTWSRSWRTRVGAATANEFYAPVAGFGFEAQLMPVAPGFGADFD